MAVLLSLVSIENARYTAPPPEQADISQEMGIDAETALMHRRKYQRKASPLPAEDTALETPAPAPMDRENYHDGDMWIQIPALDVNAPVIAGTDTADLKKGPGLYASSPMPDEEDGNVCIAGHRTTYGAWFRHVDTLAEGDEIILFTAERRFVYAVREVFVVDRCDWSVTEPTGYTTLTLTACHPPGSARQRIVVRAKRAG